MAGKYIINQTAGKRYIILEEDAEKIEGGYFDTEGVWHDLSGPLEGDLIGKYVINETGGKRIILLEEDADDIGGGYFEEDGTWVPFETEGTLKNPIYNGTSSDSDAIEAAFSIGYRTGTPSNTNKTGMRMTIWDKKAVAWSTGMSFTAGEFDTIKASFTRTEGTGSTYPNAYLIVSEKVIDTVVSYNDFNVNNMAEAYGDYLVAGVTLDSADPKEVSIDLSSFAHKKNFFVSVIYKQNVNGYYSQIKTNSIELVGE